jgi:uncharacterized membrane protein YidH (DUF202 family)
MGVLVVLFAVLVGLAVYRSGQARSRWQQIKAAKTTARNQRNTAWRQTGNATLCIAGAILILIIIFKLLK